MTTPPLMAAIIPVTPLQQNCCLIWCTKTMLGAFTDPGGEIERLKDVATQQRDRLMAPEAVADMVIFALSCPENSNPLELAVINQLTTWTKPIIDYQQTQAK